jgi:hypothetical protein
MMPALSSASSAMIHDSFDQPFAAPRPPVLCSSRMDSHLGARHRPSAASEASTVSGQLPTVNRKAFDPHLNYSRSRDASIMCVLRFLFSILHLLSSPTLPKRYAAASTFPSFPSMLLSLSDWNRALEPRLSCSEFTRNLRVAGTIRTSFSAPGSHLSHAPCPLSNLSQSRAI